MGKQPTVGKGTATTRAEHSRFAKGITAYLDRVRTDDGLSIRAVSRLSAGQKSNSWWAEIFNGEKILTTNDIHYIATELLSISPYRLVSNARALAEGAEHVPFASFVVGGMGEAGRTLTRAEERDLRQSEVELAAYRGQNEAEQPHAD